MLVNTRKGRKWLSVLLAVQLTGLLGTVIFQWLRPNSNSGSIRIELILHSSVGKYERPSLEQTYFDQKESRNVLEYRVSGTGVFSDYDEHEPYEEDTEVAGIDYEGYSRIWLERAESGEVMLIEEFLMPDLERPARIEGNIQFDAGNWRRYTEGSRCVVSYTEEGLDQARDSALQMITGMAQFFLDDYLLASDSEHMQVAVLLEDDSLRATKMEFNGTKLHYEEYTPQRVVIRIIVFADAG